VKIPPAGEVRRPEVDVAPEAIRDLAYALPVIRASSSSEPAATRQ
jgi:hypothetical protein